MGFMNVYFNHNGNPSKNPINLSKIKIDIHIYLQES